MDTIKGMSCFDINDSGSLHKTGEKRRAEEIASPSFPDGTPFKKVKENEASTTTPAAIDAGQHFAARANIWPAHITALNANHQLAQEASIDFFLDTQQAAPNENPMQATAGKPVSLLRYTSAPASVEGGPSSQHETSLFCACTAYERTGKQAAMAYLRAYVDRGSFPVPVSTISTASGRVSMTLAYQRYARVAASLDGERMVIKNETMVGWAHSHAKMALQLQLLMPNHPDKVRYAIAQLKGYTPV
ncbi:hypothetical protein LTR97_006421 [Elasticomyces elasticus]|uniref:Uncharacterized protein n=1 Tax=Elasticomyces elasticus TaxID=574655 RepID=A0AAN7W7Y1_9PEZI|nr:hypothetical protein LTR97_006421 [Elasticomyces elasticus]